MLSAPCFSWDLCFPSADGQGDLRRGRGGPASPKGLLVTGKGSRWVPCPQRNGQTDHCPVCETEWTDRHTKSPERQGQNRTPAMQSDPPVGLSLYRSQLSSVSPPHPSPARPTCVSLRARCPFVPSAGIREGDLWGKRPGRQAEGSFLPGQCVPGTCCLRDHRLGGGVETNHMVGGWAGQNQPRGREPFS